jgi:preprotein translocase subunit SecG
MFTVFLALIVLVSFLLIVVIMVQNPKGGGLSSSFGGGQVVGGYKNTNEFLDKATWGLGLTLIVLIMVSALSFNIGSQSKLIDDSFKPAIEEKAKDPNATPAASKEVNPATEMPAPPAPAQ